MFSIILWRNRIRSTIARATMKLWKCNGKVLSTWSESNLVERICYVNITYSPLHCILLYICSNMSGVEYILLHVQEPILYVIRKQYRNSPSDATPMADYYIIAGTVYQAPDLANVFNSRLVCRSFVKWRMTWAKKAINTNKTRICFCSYRRCIICKGHSKRPVPTHATIQTKDIHGTFRATKHVS